MPQASLSYLTTASADAIRMTSREISELVESRHDKVKKSIERLVKRGVITQPPMGDESYKDGSGRTVVTRLFVFEGDSGKRDSIVVVAQLSPEFTAALVDRWQKLEQRAIQESAPPSSMRKRAFGSTGDAGLDRQLDVAQGILERSGVERGERMAKLLHEAITPRAANDASDAPDSPAPATTLTEQMGNLIRESFDFTQPPAHHMTATQVLMACGVLEPSRSEATAAGCTLRLMYGSHAQRSSRGNLHAMPPMLG